MAREARGGRCLTTTDPQSLHLFQRLSSCLAHGSPTKGTVFPYYGYYPPIYGYQAPAYWYYCPSYGAYYPSVASCPEAWVPIPAS
jgi:hypothetical protein